MKNLKNWLLAIATALSFAALPTFAVAQSGEVSLFKNATASDNWSKNIATFKKEGALVGDDIVMPVIVASSYKIAKAQNHPSAAMTEEDFATAWTTRNPDLPATGKVKVETFVKVAQSGKIYLPNSTGVTAPIAAAQVVVTPLTATPAPVVELESASSGNARALAILNGQLEQLRKDAAKPGVDPKLMAANAKLQAELAALKSSQGKYATQAEFATAVAGLEAKMKQFIEAQTTAAVDQQNGLVRSVKGLLGQERIVTDQKLAALEGKVVGSKDLSTLQAWGVALAVILGFIALLSAVLLHSKQRKVAADKVLKDATEKAKQDAIDSARATRVKRETTAEINAAVSPVVEAHFALAREQVDLTKRVKGLEDSQIVLPGDWAEAVDSLSAAKKLYSFKLYKLEEPEIVWQVGLCWNRYQSETNTNYFTVKGVKGQDNEVSRRGLMRMMSRAAKDCRFTERNYDNVAKAPVQEVPTLNNVVPIDGIPKFLLAA